MKKKLLSILLATSFLAGTSINVYPTIKAKADEATVTIAVDEELYDMNIMTVTEYSDTLDWVYRMTYDTLITLDEIGNFQPGLAETWEITVLEEEDDENILFNSSNLVFDTWHTEWTTTSEKYLRALDR